jgi:nitronate monooxygenase
MSIMSDGGPTRLLLDRLGIALPIIQAPMAGVSSPAMAAAVSNAGGLGSLSVGATDVHGARAAIAALRDATDRPFNINLFCHQPAIADPWRDARWIERLRPAFAVFGAEPPPALTEIYRSFLDDEAMLELLLDERPPVLSFHFGLPPSAWIAALRRVGIVILATATNLTEAAAAEAAGVHVIVAQGWEAGGHRGIFDPDGRDPMMKTRELTRALARRTGLPVIAAGGIMDGAGIAAALREGAAAAQLGTAFVATDESLASPHYRAALAAAVPGSTVMTRTLSGRPARSLPTRFTALTANVADQYVPAYPLAYDLAKALHAIASAKGEGGFGAQWAGEGAHRARPMPAAQLIDRLLAELEAAR